MSIQELQEIISPKFDEKVFNEIITKKSDLTDIQVTKIEIGAASKKGDSYLSNICRFVVEINGKNELGKEDTRKIPVIVKYLPKNLARRKTYRSLDFFENEIIFYGTVWKSFQEFQNDSKITKKFDNVPLVLASHIDENEGFVAMYDLSFDGYTSAERGEGLDEEHTLAILSLLARFHALSLAFKEKQPDKFETAALSLKETYFSERVRPWYENFQKNVFKVIGDAVLKELPIEYYHKFENLIEKDLFGVLIDSCVVRGPLSVVTHGDVWVPNFLINYQGSKLENLVMIDFQLTRYTTLATDLAFFLFCCVSSQLIETKWDFFVEFYHKMLSESLVNYGCVKTVSLEDIRAELKEHSVMGVGMSMEALIMAQLEDDDVADLDGIQGEEAVPLESVWLIHPFEESKKRKRIATMIKFAVDKNFI